MIQQSGTRIPGKPSPRPICRSWSLKVLAAPVLIALVFGVLFRLEVCAAAQDKGHNPDAPVAHGVDVLDRLDEQLADLVDLARKSVVSVRGQMRGTPPGGRPGQPSIQVTGSGFLAPDGIVITTAEVVANIINPSVTFSDGPSIRATAIGLDVRANIAILRVPVRNHAIGLRWGESTKVRAGNLVVTIGNHSGFTDSAALGMIANPHQRAMSSRDGKHYDALIQFQGAIGDGGIGSPLLNLRGEVIGMVIGMAMRPGVDTDGARMRIFGASAMGFALPSATVRETLDGIIQSAKPLPEAGWLGIGSASRIDGADVAVREVYVGSPADRAGILPGDIVVTVDDEPIRSYEALRRVADQLSAGQKVRIDVKRGDRTLLLLLDITPKPTDTHDIKRREAPPRIGLANHNFMICEATG